MKSHSGAALKGPREPNNRKAGKTGQKSMRRSGPPECASAMLEAAPSPSIGSAMPTAQANDADLETFLVPRSVESASFISVADTSLLPCSKCRSNWSTDWRLCRLVAA
jgi:hypothetical protein